MTAKDHLTECETVVAAGPGIDEPFGQSILRLKARLAFDSSTESIHENSGIPRTERNGFANLASAHQQRLASEIQGGAAAVEREVAEIEQRTRSFASLILQINPAGTHALRNELEHFTQEIQAVRLQLQEKSPRVAVRLKQVEMAPAEK